MDNPHDSKCDVATYASPSRKDWEDPCGFWTLRNGVPDARRLRYRIPWNEPAFGALRGQTGGVRPSPLTPRPSRSPANNCGALLLQTRSRRARAHEAPHRTSPHSRDCLLRNEFFADLLHDQRAPIRALPLPMRVPLAAGGCGLARTTIEKRRDCKSLRCLHAVPTGPRRYRHHKIIAAESGVSPHSALSELSA